MEAFTIPQFLDVEDKIIGPITTRQFIICIVGAGMMFIAYKLADLVTLILVGLLIVVLVLVIGFVKINGQYFHYFLINVIQTLKRPGLRVWRKKYTTTELKDWLKKPSPTLPLGHVMFKKAIGTSRLSELALIVDTGGFYVGEETSTK
jgi:hypothetical protein